MLRFTSSGPGASPCACSVPRVLRDIAIKDGRMDFRALEQATHEVCDRHLPAGVQLRDIEVSRSCIELVRCSAMLGAQVPTSYRMVLKAVMPAEGLARSQLHEVDPIDAATPFFASVATACSPALLRGPMHNAPEVRRCHRCGEAAVLSGLSWPHVHVGIDTGLISTDYRCQACGHAFRLRPPARVAGYALAGILLICTPMGLPVLLLANWMRKLDARNPIVPGAVPPAWKYRVGPPMRRCGHCGGTATARRLWRKKLAALPVGRVAEYGCGGCARTFTVEGPVGMVANIAVVLPFGLLAAAIAVVAEPLHERVGAALVSALVVGGAVLLTLVRARARWKHRELPDGLE